MSKGGVEISDWAGNETVDFSVAPQTGVNALRTDARISLFLNNVSQMSGGGNFGEASEYDSGVWPSVALNDRNVAVEVHTSEGLLNALWYHVGQVEGDKINWGRSIQYDTGVNPSVAINSNGLVVAVHQSQSHDTLWYHVGRVEGDKINWGRSIEYDTGWFPSVAINSSGLVVAVHQSGSAPLCYRVGRVEGDKINWGGSIEYDTGVSPSVAINSNGLVVEVHRSQGLSTALWYQVGRVEGDKINWGGSIRYDTGITPAVAITADGLVVEVHKSEGLSGALWYHVGRVEGDKINWSESIKYSMGTTPKVACNGKLAVETHEVEKRLLYSILMLSGFDPIGIDEWIEGRGLNSYCYYMLDSIATKGRGIEKIKSITVDAGAPFIYTILIKNEDSIEFPTGAILKITGPDGKAFDREQNDEKVLAMMSGSSLRSLAIKDPLPGVYTVDLTIPTGVEFHFEFQTLPSKDVIETIEITLAAAHSTAQGQKRLQKRQLFTGSLLAEGLLSIIGSYILIKHSNSVDTIPLAALRHATEGHLKGRQKRL